MQKTGRVISSEKGQVEVCFERPEACARCGACAGQKHHTLVKIPGDAPVGRNGRPEDVAQAMVYLADATFVTGQVLPVNGGYVI